MYYNVKMRHARNSHYCHGHLNILSIFIVDKHVTVNNQKPLNVAMATQ